MELSEVDKKLIEECGINTVLEGEAPEFVCFDSNLALLISKVEERTREQIKG